MRRRDLLKMGLVIAAIPVGAHMMWERCKTREDKIREKVHEKLKMIMCGGDQRALEVIKAYPFVDDVLNLTFCIVAEPVKMEEVNKDALAFVKTIQAHTTMDGGLPLIGEEIGLIAGTVHLVRGNYSHQVDEGALSVLLAVAVSSKYYQMRTEIPME